MPSKNLRTVRGALRARCKLGRSISQAGGTIGEVGRSICELPRTAGERFRSVSALANPTRHLVGAVGKARGPGGEPCYA